MFLEQIEKNKRASFEQIVERNKQNKETVVVNGNEYSYTTKRGLEKKFIGFNSFNQYRKSSFYPSKVERVNGFFFAEVEAT